MHACVGVSVHVCRCECACVSIDTIHPLPLSRSPPLHMQHLTNHDHYLPSFLPPTELENNVYSNPRPSRTSKRIPSCPTSTLLSLKTLKKKSAPWSTQKQKMENVFFFVCFYLVGSVVYSARMRLNCCLVNQMVLS